jgi:glutamyl/glutaminyl-tRNA synthetase
MVRSRIAPTPSGYLHIGNAINFVITWLWVRKENGKLRLRIDDLDAPRTKPAYLDDIFQTLEWLGLDWDEGPQTPDEHEKIYSQNLRAERYSVLTEQLVQTGKVFACGCSRKNIEGQYPGTCIHKKLPLNMADTSLRIITPDDEPVIVTDINRGDIAVNLYEVMRHFIIRRRDGLAAYQVASLADDIDFGINVIVRGEDLLYSTAAQLYLAKLVGNETFQQATFYHHPLLKNENGLKLSKSAGGTSLKSWREAGKTKADFYSWMSRLLNWSEEAKSLDEMLQIAKAGSPLRLQIE